MIEKKQTLVSVIVPVYNVESYLSSCIDSILCQTYETFELILIDDGSTDRSGQICETYREKDPRITVIHQENRGLSQARNTGLDHMNGDMIVFIDSDDSVTPDCLEYLLSLFSYADDCSITACNHYIVRNGKRVENSQSDEPVLILSARDAMEEALFHLHINVSSWAKMYKKEVFANLRFPKSRLYEDTWIFGDLLKETKTVVFGRKSCYLYEVREHSIVNSGYKPARLEYIDSARKLAEDAIKMDNSLQAGCIRRVNHARMSTLRYMEKNPDRTLANQLRKEILKEAPQYIRNPKTPSRDRIGICLLHLSLGAFYKGWRLYSLFRQ